MLELQGGNFTKLAEVDLTALASLQTLQVGAGALSGATSLICESRCGREVGGRHAEAEGAGAGRWELRGRRAAVPERWVSEKEMRSRDGESARAGAGRALFPLADGVCVEWWGLREGDEETCRGWRRWRWASKV